MASYQEGQRRVLLDLPEEVLLQIVKNLAPPHNSDGHLAEGIYENAVEHFRATCRKAFHLCEPLWWRCLSVQTWVSYKRLKAFFSCDPSRPHYVQHLELLPDYRGVRDVQKHFPEMTGLVSLCSNLERLCVWPKSILNDVHCEPLIEIWETALASQFESTHFNQLRDCYMRLWITQPRLANPLIQPILNAPRLVDLTLEGVNLSQLPLHSIPKHPTALKKLKLSRCWIDEPTLAAILAAPLSLASFDFSMHFPRDGDPVSTEGEYRMILRAIELVTLLQSNITYLGLMVRDGAGFESEDLKDEFDFSGLRSLKELTLNAASTYFFRPLLQRFEGSCLWCPINGFDKLPPSLERINLQSDTEDVDLGGLADALLGPRYAGKRLPSSLRLCCDVQKEHERPLPEEDQEIDDRNLRAIETFMTQLPFFEIEYVKRWFLLEPDPVSGHVYSCTRALEAKRKANANNVDGSGRGPRPFELKENSYTDMTFI